MRVLVLVPGHWGRGSPLVVHRGQDAEVAVATVTLMCWNRRCFALGTAQPDNVALLNLGLVELLEVRLDDRAVELPADAAEVGEDGGHAPQRRVEQQAQLVVLGVLVRFD